jgi:hypothetical protein
MSYSVGDCVTGLPSKFDNRTDLGVTTDGSIGIVAVTQAIQQLTETFEFEELKYQTPVPPAATLALTQGNPVVPIASLLATIAGNTNFPQFQSIAAEFVDITDVYTFWMWFAPGISGAGRALEYRRVTTIDLYSYGVTSNQAGQLGQAPPVYYTRFGSVLQVGPVPDQAYQFFVRVKLRHPFPAASVAAQVVFMPDSWQQAAQYLACYNLALGEGAETYIEMFKDRLMALGVDVSVLRLRPQMERDERHNSRQMSLRTASYTYSR